MNQKKIGEFIAICRKEKKITQEQLAQKLNVNNRTISRWENGKTMPDYSILKQLCEELDISINELLSGERIKDEFVIKANENLNNILKEYYKMKKQKNIIKIILIIISVILLKYIISTITMLVIATFSLKTENISDVEKYNKEYYLKKYGKEISSSLIIFPEDNYNLKDTKFTSSFTDGLFGADGYILLSTKYTKEQFNKEVNRLSNINLKISKTCSKNAPTHTNYIKYDENSYEYPAYITIDGFYGKYEYALINKENLQITYLYISSVDKENKKYNKYLKKDKSEYEEMNQENMYSLYNHSFDNNNVYIGYNDCKK